MRAVGAPITAWRGPRVGGHRHPGAAPPLAALRTELVRLGAHRVEVVAPRDHRESWYVAEEVPLARGWARQRDYVLNPLFYKGSLGLGEYLDWLHRRGVDHIALPRHGPLDFGSTDEARVLRTGAPFLRVVWSDDDWTVYAVPAAVPIAPGVLSSTRTALRLQAEPGTVEVHVRWSRWLSVTGPACLERHGDEVRLSVRAAGVITLSSSLAPKGRCS